MKEQKGEEHQLQSMCGWELTQEVAVGTKQVAKYTMIHSEDIQTERSIKEQRSLLLAHTISAYEEGVHKCVQ